MPRLGPRYFNPRGLRRPRLDQTRAFSTNIEISIHEVFADLDFFPLSFDSSGRNFNPRGLRRPRPQAEPIHTKQPRFQSTRSSQTSTLNPHPAKPMFSFQSTRSSQTSTMAQGRFFYVGGISIHEVFADLDSKHAQ